MICRLKDGLLELCQSLSIFAVQSYRGIRLDIFRAAYISLGLTVHLAYFYSLKVLQHLQTWRLNRYKYNTPLFGFIFLLTPDSITHFIIS